MRTGAGIAMVAAVMACTGPAERPSTVAPPPATVPSPTTTAAPPPDAPVQPDSAAPPNPSPDQLIGPANQVPIGIHTVEDPPTQPRQ